MVLETLAMLSCTGRALVCLYCTRPKAAPMKQITMPQYISVVPAMPPRPLNLTVSNRGMWMSASLAFTPVAANRVRKPSTIQNQYLLFLIIFGTEIITKDRRNMPTLFLEVDYPRQGQFMTAPKPFGVQALACSSDGPAWE